jgi:hypothetical protein
MIDDIHPDPTIYPADRAQTSADLHSLRGSDVTVDEGAERDTRFNETRGVDS